MIKTRKKKMVKTNKNNKNLIFLKEITDILN